MIDVRSYAKVPGTLTQPSINPYSQESTTGSLHWCITQPFIGRIINLSFGGLYISKEHALPFKGSDFYLIPQGTLTFSGKSIFLLFIFNVLPVHLMCIVSHKECFSRVIFWALGCPLRVNTCKMPFNSLNLRDMITVMANEQIYSAHIVIQVSFEKGHFAACLVQVYNNA